MRTVKVAAVQATPVFLDREATTAKACALVREAADEGARLVVFPEAFIPTYPDWVWRSRPWDDGASDWYNRLVANAVTVPGPTIEALSSAARAAQACVAIGVNEKDPTGGTLYNTLLFFGTGGELLGKHRKLMPTGGERLVWGMGDGSGLQVHDTPVGRLGGLICWENYMPLARAALYGQGVELYVAPTWDNSDVWVPTLRHIAKEGGCHVIGVTPFLRGSDVPAEIPGRDDIYGGAEDSLSQGNTTIVAAGGSIVAGPLIGSEGILYADLDMEAFQQQKRMFDPSGHYARSDVLRLVVDRRPKVPATFLTDGTGETTASTHGAVPSPEAAPPSG
jgi:nitrilase